MAKSKKKIEKQDKIDKPEKPSKPRWLKILVLLSSLSLTIAGIWSFFIGSFSFGLFWLITGILITGEIIDWKTSPRWLNKFHIGLLVLEIILFIYILCTGFNF